MSKILVTGASGHLGSLVIANLLERGVPASDIIAGSRDPAKLSALAAKGIAARKVDFDDASTLAAAFAGIDRLLIISTDELGTPGKRLEQHKAAVAAAKSASVGRVFYTSLPKAESSAVSFAPDHFGTEEAIKASGLPYTIFRNSWYMENLFMSLPNALASGQWFTAAGDGKTSHVSRADIAKAIAGGLISPPAENKIYTLTGEAAYSNAEIAALVSEATGKPLAVVNLTDAQLAEGMAAHGVPAPFIPTLVSFDTAIRAGDLGMVTTDAADLAGGKLVTLKDFIAANKASLGA
ncbi:SDR family oxidoreductase [Rhizobium sp. RU36D]|uniref:SDR family oxidoreductase n=1 Tax=Rhizobium sp. RU36D TaxID=1907415 RepID=UPI0009D85770|nr:NAD(P)H dehydrogenase (quinone) [Rhizobium sp. RU36D]